MLIIINIISLIFVALVLLIEIVALRKGHSAREYSQSLQEQIDRLRNRHDVAETDHKRLAETIAHIQRTHLGLPAHQIFKTNIH